MNLNASLRSRVKRLEADTRSEPVIVMIRRFHDLTETSGESLEEFQVRVKAEAAEAITRDPRAPVHVFVQRGDLPQSSADLKLHGGNTL